MSTGDQSIENSYNGGNSHDLANPSNTSSGINDSDGSNYNINSPMHQKNSPSGLHDLTNVPVSPSGDNLVFGGVPLGSVSGSCSPTPNLLSTTDLSRGFLSLRHNNLSAPPYSALTSPCLSGKLTPLPHHSLTMNSGPGDRHSLQNSPFYTHYPPNGSLQAQLQRQFSGISPGPSGALFTNGVNGFKCSQSLVSRNGLYQDAAFSLPGFRPTNSGSGCCPQRELFPSIPSNNNFFGPGLLMQDRLHYYAVAQKHGFIVGAELERIKENSRRSTSQSYGRISAYFRNRYGETEAKTKAAYLQLGVRVPSKDHVSEIVGKGGQKIKLIREETGALITTPGEQEEHVFIIEAPPEIAMRVAQHLATRAQEITQSKLVAGERRRGSTSSQPTCGTMENGFVTNLSGNTSGTVNNTSSVVNHTPGSSSATLNSTNGSGILTALTSATNSPLHPSTIRACSSTFANNVLPSNGSPSFRGTNNGNCLSSAYSSLPSSPGNPTNQTSHMNLTGTNGNLFSNTTSTSGSRILLARGRISVPQDMVGKIIGTQGSIITTIQKDTGTEIKSPPKEATRGPNATSDFEISAYQGLGLSSNQAAECRVQQAKQLIGHLVMRQLERRASEEVEDASGSSNVSADDQQQQRNGTSNSGGTPRTNSNWMWPDVAQMDSQEAREVLDRILAESKNKTRRAKELAAGAIITTTTSGIDSSSCVLNTSNSLLNCNNDPSFLSNSKLAHYVHHSSQHLLSNGGGVTPGSQLGYFDSINHVLNGCENLVQDSTDSVSFNSHNTNRFNKIITNSGHCNDSEFQLHNLHGFELSDDHGASLDCTSGSGVVHDLWNSASNFTNIVTNQDNRSSILRHNHQHNNTTNLLNQQQLSNIPVNNHTELDSHFDSNSIFSFRDSHLNSSDDQDHYNFPPPTLDVHRQSLTRRHSDWVVDNTPNLISNEDFIPSLSSKHLHSNQVDDENNGLMLMMMLNDPQSQKNSCSNHYDFIQALDQLCLNSPGATKDVQITSASSSSINGLITPACPPPGFESQQSTDAPIRQSGSAFFTSNKDNSNGHLTDPWSTNHMNSIRSTNVDYFSSNAPSSNSLKQLFTTTDRSLSTGINSSIWSHHQAPFMNQQHQQPIPSINDSSTDLSCFFDTTMFSEIERPPKFLQNDLSSDAVSVSNNIEDQNDYSPGVMNVSSARCGTIGEGRRRPNFNGHVVSHSNEALNLSVSSAIASFAEVA